MKKAAQIGLIGLFIATLVFHGLVLTKLIPYSIVWGGRLKTDTDMYRFEAVSLVLNSFFLLIILVKSGLIVSPVSTPILNGTLWAMVGLFLLNSVGNLLSRNDLERLVFTPITLLLALLLVVLLIGK